MNTIWAPWRVEYITKPKENSCILCSAPADGDHLILLREKHCFSIMNRFPYTTGHCMVAPYRHIGHLLDLEKNEFTGILEMVKKIVSAIQSSLNPQGFNIGCNIGTVAGAGIADHLHVHIVPRWNGDTNFMPVLSGTHIISEHIEKTREKIMGKLS
ncbi:MAG: HIT domain-containing protein [Desulfomonilia bacterium]|nr:HIT domain-containing protein [Desulfomonilia bacterium]